VRIQPFALHLSDLLFEAAFGEVLYQGIGKTLFRSFEATETYLHIDTETGDPCIISKFRIDFNECIEKKLQAAIQKKMTSSGEWDSQIIPRREELNFSAEENYLLGKLYAIALITNDWDLVNNIMLSNAGCVGSTKSARKVMVVDGGNKFHFGFDGLTCDETAFKNILFNPSSTPTFPHRSYTHTLPFEDAVYLNLPRLLIPELFSLTNPELFRGFKETIGEARTTLAANPFCIQQAIKRIEHLITLDSDKRTLERFKDKRSTLINHAYYFPQTATEYGLDAVLKACCNSLHIACTKIEAGTSTEEINLDSLRQYLSAQRLGTESSAVRKPDTTITSTETRTSNTDCRVPEPTYLIEPILCNVK